jgi:hypothetical protein
MTTRLVATHSSPSALLDMFVMLSDEAGNRLVPVKTRTIHETLGSQCVFPFVHYPRLNVMVGIRSRRPTNHFGSWRYIPHASNAAQRAELSIETW